MKTKKKTGGLKLVIFLVVLIAGAFGATTLSGCDCRSSVENPVSYYGCPNSERVKKLRLGRVKRNA